MTWICSKCGRKFKNKNQYHSCYKLDLEYHFRNKSDSLVQLFNYILDKISEFGKYEVNVVKTMIQLKTESTFLGITVRKNMLIVEFTLPYEWQEFPVVKTVKASSKRYFHVSSIYDMEDLTPVYFGKLHEAYKLINGE